MVVEDFARHGVDSRSDLVTVLLRDFCKALTFWEIAADDTIITLIAATLKAGIRVGIVDRKALVTLLVMLHAVAILEFRAIVNSDGLECAMREF